MSWRRNGSAGRWRIGSAGRRRACRRRGGVDHFLRYEPRASRHCGIALRRHALRRPADPFLLRTVSADVGIGLVFYRTFPLHSGGIADYNL